MVRPDDHRKKAEHEQPVDHLVVTPDRLARVVRDDFGDDAETGQNEHVNLGMAEEPEEMLPEQRRAAAAAVPRRAADDQAAGREEARAGQAVHQLHERRGLQRREREQEQERGDELRPDEERHAHPAHAPSREAARWW